MPQDLKFNEPHASLAGTATLYMVGQVRLTSAGTVRYQCGGNEWSVNVTTQVAQWLASQPAPWLSAAGSGAKYIPCLIRPEQGDGVGLRVQIPGAALNRPWGAEFIHLTCPCPTNVVAALAAAKPEPVTVEPGDEAEPDVKPDPIDLDPGSDEEPAS